MNSNEAFSSKEKIGKAIDCCIAVISQLVLIIIICGFIEISFSGIPARRSDIYYHLSVWSGSIAYACLSLLLLITLILVVLFSRYGRNA